MAAGNRLARRRTFAVGTNEVDFAVLEYTCRDSSVISSLGKSCMESSWKIAVGGGSSMLDLKLTVDTKIVGKPEVSFVCGGKPVFPPSGSKSKGKLKEDLKWQCPFRGTIQGIGERGRYELKPEHASSDIWYPATVLEQRSDGLFKAVAMMPSDEKLPKEVTMPAVRQENLREVDGQKKQVRTPMRSLVLEVPVKDPLRSTLSVDGSQLITHFFARPTPPPPKGAKAETEDSTDGPTVAKPVHPRLLFSVSKDRSAVTCEVGHSVLVHFLNGEVRRPPGQDGDKSKRSWSVQIGPFATHTIEVERRYTLSRVVTLVVDGDLLVESTAEDLESPEGFWECRFRFVGEKFLDWKIFETTPAGGTLRTQTVVSEKRTYHHDCVISIPTDERYSTTGVDLSTAKLTIDGTDFSELPETREVHGEESLVLAPEALKGVYSLSAPSKINYSPPSSLSTILDSMGVSCGAGGGLFCCGGSAHPAGLGDIVAVPTRMEATGPTSLDPAILFSPIWFEKPEADTTDGGGDAEAQAAEAAATKGGTPALSGQEPQPEPAQEEAPAPSSVAKAFNGGDQPKAKKPAGKKCCTVQ